MAWRRIIVTAIAIVLLVLVFPVISQPLPQIISGYVYYGNRDNPAKNASITFINENKSEEIHACADEYGFFAIDVGYLGGYSWKAGEKVKIIATGINEYRKWEGNSTIILDEKGYQYIDIIMHPEERIFIDFFYVPENPTDLDEIRFFVNCSNNMNIVNYTWNFGDGSVSYEKTPKHRYGDDGVFNVSLSITDKNFGKKIVHHILTVKNVPPVAVIYYHVRNFSLKVDSTASFDLDGKIEKYEWKWRTNGKWHEGKAIEEITYEKEGNYTMCLRITDDDGAQDIACIDIHVERGKESASPIANFTWEPKSPSVNTPVKFIDCSFDKGGYIVNYTWDFGDGNISHQKNPVHEYNKAGNFEVRLIVTDNDGFINEKVMVITVIQKRGNDEPLAVPSLIFIVFAFVILLIKKRFMQ